MNSVPRAFLVAMAIAAGGLAAQDRPSMARSVDHLTRPVVAETEVLAYRLRAHAAADGAGAPDAELVLERTGPDALAADLRSPWAGARLRRTASETLLAVPAHGVVFVGEGALPDGAVSLAPDGFVQRMVGDRAAGLAGLRALALLQAGAMDAGGAVPTLPIPDSVTLTATAGRGLVAASSERRGFAEGMRRLCLERVDPGLGPLDRSGLRAVAVGREELERLVFFGLRRALSLQWPGPFGIAPPAPARVPHGELCEHDGQLLAILDGTPEQVGAAHGALLAPLVRNTIHSTVYLVGLIETVRTGKWFPGVLDEAWRRLRPHMPDRHVAEMRALADAVPDVSWREVRLGNVFPEYFHCSGFAAFGKATVDGKLYHGRVLDYMTLIGLQQAAVTQLVQVDGQRPFLNVGYAGFVGVVSGMNDAQISLGEMGGAGRGAWDGVPMATLMRRALEECDTLDAVKALWRDSPRTCEYYYVFADGKIPDAVGVAATPDKIEFVAPGEGHPLIGEGIEDVVVLSAGSRLKLLRERVTAGHGKIDRDAAIGLMARPVAMRSNLHNVLFVPQDGVAWVAHAVGDRPAADQRYVRYDVRELLRQRAAANGADSAGVFRARDTLRVEPDASKDAERMLDHFDYVPGAFDVSVAASDREWDAVVRFPTPKPSGSARNDEVVMEWFAARENGGRVRSAPAVLVLHILSGRFRVARAIARYLRSHGVHAFVIHQPYYGERGTRDQRRDPGLIVPRFHQAVADARRARDAIAALPGIDTSGIAIQGTSLGGFVAALTASLDRGFDSTFIMLAGADLPSMIERGGQDTAKIRAALQRAGFDARRIAELSRAIDPLHVAHRLDARSTWLFSASFDEVVPAANAAALGKAAGLDQEHHRWLPAGHYTAAAFLPTVFEAVVRELHR